MRYCIHTITTQVEAGEMPQLAAYRQATNFLREFYASAPATA